MEESALHLWLGATSVSRTAGRKQASCYSWDDGRDGQGWCGERDVITARLISARKQVGQSTERHV